MLESATTISDRDLASLYSMEAGVHPEKRDDEVYMGYMSSSGWPQSRMGTPETRKGMAEGDPELKMYPVFVKRGYFADLAADHLESMLRWQRVADVGTYTVTDRWKDHCLRKAKKLFAQKEHHADPS